MSDTTASDYVTWLSYSPGRVEAPLPVVEPIDRLIEVGFTPSDRFRKPFRPYVRGASRPGLRPVVPPNRSDLR